MWLNRSPFFVGSQLLDKSVMEWTGKCGPGLFRGYARRFEAKDTLDG